MQFWASFGTSFLQQKVGDYPPVLKVGDLSPCSPCSNAHAAVQNTTWDDGASYLAEILAAPGAKCSPVELLRSSAFCSSICIALNLSSRFFSRLYLALRFNLHRPIFTHYESSWIAYRLRFQPTTIYIVLDRCKNVFPLNCSPILAEIIIIIAFSRQKCNNAASLNRCNKPQKGTVRLR